MSAELRVVVVEGADDRNFLKGALHRLGCRDLGPAGFQDALGKDWGLSSADGAFIRLVDAGGKDNLVRAAALALRPGATEPARLVLVGDPDDTGPYASAQAAWQARIRQGLQARGLHPRALDLIAWGDPAGEGPHDLEALFWSALRQADGARADCIGRWLAAPPIGRLNGKARAWSFFAKWQDDGSAAQFFQALWRVPDLALALEDRLHQVGAWSVLQTISGAETSSV
ncbi:hypothetical protein L6R53_28235 [Myxococcota bacterium]|nr:hypothetical protein [Myxococcota bacterium]